MTYLFAYLLILAPLIWALFFWTLLRILKSNIEHGREVK